MEWTEEMSVGVQVIDDDHKKLIDMLNDLNDGVITGKNNRSLEGVIEGLSIISIAKSVFLPRPVIRAGRRTRRNTTCSPGV
jgi:hypothetical protein